MISLQSFIKALVHANRARGITFESNGHSDRVSLLTVEIGTRLDGVYKVPDEKLELLRLAGYAHDIGKIGVDVQILEKPGPLSFSQMKAVQAHSEIGYSLLFPSGIPPEIYLTTLYHHECWDGSGYPTGIKADNIPLFARIVFLVDVWDALNSDRPYRKAYTFDVAMKIMNEMTPKFDPLIYAAFLQMIEERKT